MAKVNKIIGIDISKEKFDACFSFNENEKSVQDSYSYDEKGIRQFLKEVQDDCICVMEATGVYHLRLAYALYERRVSVSIVNPLSVKNFSRAVMCRTKTEITLLSPLLWELVGLLHSLLGPHVMFCNIKCKISPSL